MSAYYIWNPHINQENNNKIEFILTNGDVPSGFVYSNEFIQNILNDLGIDSEVVEWEVEPFRSKYFSEYSDDEYWQDVWPVIWKVQAIVTKSVEITTNKNVPWIGTNATGKGWADGPDDETVIGCLVVCDFKNEKSLQNTLNEINGNEFGEIRIHYSAEKPLISQSITLGNNYQLQINVGKFESDFYSSDSSYAERVLEICRAHDGIINFEEHEG